MDGLFSCPETPGQLDTPPTCEALPHTTTSAQTIRSPSNAWTRTATTMRTTNAERQTHQHKRTSPDAQKRPCKPVKFYPIRYKGKVYKPVTATLEAITKHITPYKLPQPRRATVRELVNPLENRYLFW